MTCHEGIADIRDKKSGMMQAILQKAEEAGVRGNDCVVCHGGDPEAKEKEDAHRGTLKYFESHEGPKAFTLILQAHGSMKTLAGCVIPTR